MKTALALFLGVVALNFSAWCADLKPGLCAEYYVFQDALREYPDLSDQKPSIKRVESNINFKNGTNWSGISAVKDFCIRWTGYIQVSIPGAYTFSLESDDGSQLFIYDRQIIDNDGLHDFRERSGMIDLPAGRHRIRVQFFQRVAGMGCRLFWQRGNGKKEIVPAEAFFYQEPQPLGRPPSGPGLIGQYYLMGRFIKNLCSFPVYERPTSTRVDRVIGFTDLASFELEPVTENFYVLWTGHIEVPVSGKYIFFVRSDDGARLTVDDHLVMSADRDRRVTETDGTIELTAGAHDIQLEYFQGRGDASCILSWQVPDGRKEVVPPAVLSH
jgi:hypothetical protein